MGAHPGQSDGDTGQKELAAMQEIIDTLYDFSPDERRRMLEWVVAYELDLPGANFDAVIDQ